MVPWVTLDRERWLKPVRGFPVASPASPVSPGTPRGQGGAIQDGPTVSEANQQRWQRKGADHAGLFREIERLGDPQQAEVAGRALNDMEAALAKTVAATPDAFGATADPASQQAAVDRLMQNMAQHYLEQIAGDLRKHSGYIRIWHRWVHRSIITYAVYLLIGGFALTFFIPMILSPRPGAWWQGLAGLVITLAGGIGILVNVRK